MMNIECYNCHKQLATINVEPDAIFRYSIFYCKPCEKYTPTEGPMLRFVLQDKEKDST